MCSETDPSSGASPLSERYGIAEWYGFGFLGLTPSEREDLAKHALGDTDNTLPSCPYQEGGPKCGKKGGVCGLRKYSGNEGRVVEGIGSMVVTCPRRFEQDGVVFHWLADILGLDPRNARLAREVPFMANTRTGKPAGKIDIVIGESAHRGLVWHGLEIQAVYFSGIGMRDDFLTLSNDKGDRPRFPGAVRRPDWRSSSAKRLLPQLQIKAPTLRRWAAKMAVCVDWGFFDSIGGPSESPRQDLDSGDIIWMIPELVETPNGAFRLTRGYWEVLTLEESEVKLQSAKTVTRSEFEDSLRARLGPFPTTHPSPP